MDSKTEQILKDAAATIESLRDRLAKYEDGPPLSEAIQKAVERPAQPDLGFNKTVGKIMRDGVFAPRDVAKQRTTAKGKKQADRDALTKAKGIKPSKFTKDGR